MLFLVNNLINQHIVLRCDVRVLSGIAFGSENSGR